MSLPGLPILAGVVEATVALSRPAPMGIHLLQWGIVAAFVLLGVCVRELVIQVDAEKLTFGFGPVRRRVLLSDISAVRVVDSAALHLGLGIHSTADRRMAWIATKGPAVEVDVFGAAIDKPAAYVISTARPHDLASALQSGQASRTLDGG